MKGIYLMLGGNLGDVAVTFREAMALLSEKKIIVLRVSESYRTPAWPDASQPEYLNQAIEVSWEGTPEDLLANIQEVETALGRVRSVRNANRTLDLDIVLWGNAVIHSPALVVPHPRMHERLFVLNPMCDLAPELIHPTLGKTMAQLREHLRSG